MPFLSKKSFAKPHVGLSKQIKVSNSTSFKSPLLTKNNIDKILKNSNLSQSVSLSNVTPEHSQKGMVKRSKSKALNRSNSNLSEITINLSFEKKSDGKIVDESDASDLSHRMNEPAIKECYFQFIKQLSQSSMEKSSEISLDFKSPQIKSRNRNNNKRSQNKIKEKLSSKKGKKNNDKNLQKKAKNFTVSLNNYHETSDSGISLSQEKLDQEKLNKTEYTQFMQSYLEYDILKQQEKKGEKTKHNICSPSQESIVIKTNKIKRKVTKVSDKNIKQKRQSKDKIEGSKQLTIQEKMCLIHESRNVGLYVLCDICNKARYLPDIKDPLDLPEKWYCSMNRDKLHNKCRDPEEVNEDEDYLIENEYNAGSIVWVKMDGYPWWPAMVEDDPDTEQYFWLEESSMVPTYYHVTFFDSHKATRAWIQPSRLKPFKKNLQNPQYQVSKKNIYASRILAGTKKALDAVDLPLIKRLRKYSFILNYDISNNVKTSSKRKLVEKEKKIIKKRPQKIKMTKHQTDSSRENSPSQSNSKKIQKQQPIKKRGEKDMDPNINFSDILREVSLNDFQDLDISLLE